MFDKLRKAISKTSKKISTSLSHILSKENSIDKIKEELGDVLLSADLGAKFTSELINKIKISNTKDEIIDLLRAGIDAKMQKAYFSDNINEIKSKAPYVIMLIGVNGTGKTTTAAKIANYYKKQGFSVRLVAADTFRAAASEQIEYWAEKIGANITSCKDVADAAAVAYTGVLDAQLYKDDIVIIDTAGRIHVRDDLMMELDKISRVIKKLDVSAPHEILLVMDATIGQTSASQAKAFIEKIHPTAIVMTKMDGTSKGGALVSVVDEFNLPVKFVGVGESIDDIELFNSRSFAESLLDIS